MIRLFWAMLSFMSRLPVPQRWTHGLEIDHYVRGIVTFPFIGLLLGAIAGLAFELIQPGGGLPIAAFISVLVLALVTGGLHLDGVADTCDGVFSARPRERMLEIMRDSRLGTHGGLGLIFILVGKILVISELALRGNAMIPVLAGACVAGRSAVVVMMYHQRYARAEGMGNLFIGKISGRQFLTTLVIGLLLCMGLLNLRGVLAMLAVVVVTGALVCALRRTLGGQTGDTLGAAIEVGELVFLLALL